MACRLASSGRGAAAASRPIYSQHRAAPFAAFLSGSSFLSPGWLKSCSCSSTLSSFASSSSSSYSSSSSKARGTWRERPCLFSEADRLPIPSSNSSDRSYSSCASRLLAAAALAGVSISSFSSTASSPTQCEERTTDERKADEPVPWHYGYRWYVKEDRSSAAGASADQAVWDSGLRGPRWPASPPKDGRSERLFTPAMVAEHNGSTPGMPILVTYRDGVYDVTDYIREHPGGHFILNAAGGPIDPWWAYWAQHHITPAAGKALERMRVGRLMSEEDKTASLPSDHEEQMGGGVWAEEQLLESRAANRRMSWRIAEMPYQSVTKCSALVGSYLTSAEALYVRNHAPVPSVDPEDVEEHTLSLLVEGEELATLSLGEMKRRIPTCTITSVLQCTGNRAADNIACNGAQSSGFAGSDDEFIGLGMLGNARWSGYQLATLLSELVSADTRATWIAKDLHVTFEGLDGYYTSVPLAHIMDETKDCLLATELNGQPLPPDHGFPVRVLLPGVVGARQVKWVTKIEIGPLADSPWTKHFYRSQPVRTPIYYLPMNSVILSPQPGDSVSAGETSVLVEGVAYPGSVEAEVAVAEVSYDRGQSWKEAELLSEEVEKGDAKGIYRGWTRFRVELKLPAAQGLGCGGPLPELWCRLRNAKGECQSERSSAMGGYLYNGYHKVPIVRK